MAIKFAYEPDAGKPWALGGEKPREEITDAARKRARRDRGIHRRIARGLMSHEELHEYIADKRAIPTEMEE